MKHVGRMKNNSAKVVVAYRTLPGDSSSALVVGTQGLPDAYHDALMQIVQEDSGQNANELADVLAVRKFPDGGNMLELLHTRGHLKKVPTTLVLMTPNPQTTIQLDELNKIIAENKGVSIDDLAIADDSNKPKTEKSIKTTSADMNVVAEEIVTTPVAMVTPTPEVLRSKADQLLEEAQALRALADSMEPAPKAKKKVPAKTAA